MFQEKFYFKGLKQDNFDGAQVLQYAENALSSICFENIEQGHGQGNELCKKSSEGDGYDGRKWTVSHCPFIHKARSYLRRIIVCVSSADTARSF